MSRGILNFVIAWRVKEIVDLLLANKERILLVCAGIFLVWQACTLFNKVNSGILSQEKPRHGDEEVFTRVAVRMAYEGDFNPRWFCHPAATLIYPMALVYYLKFNSSKHFTNQRAALHPKVRYNYAVRMVGFVYLLLSVGAMFLLVQKSSGVLGAIVAIFYLCNSKLFVRYSSFLRNDGSSVFFVCLLLGVIFFSYKSTDWKRHFAVGLAAGAAIVTKYYLIFALFAYVGVLIDLKLRNYDHITLVRLVSIAFLGILLGLFLLSPFLFIDFNFAFQQIVLQVGWAHPSRPIFSFWKQLNYFLAVLWERNGVIGVSLIIAGLSSFVYKRNWVVLMAGVSALFYLALISSVNSYFPRWILPLFPILAIYLGQGVSLICRALFLLSLRFPRIKSITR